MKAALDGGADFCQELVRGFDEPVKILECLFARPREIWKKVFDDAKIFYAEHLGDKKFILELADKNKFSEQVKWADAIYLRGGDNESDLIDLLKKNQDWQKELDGKTLAGSSAGADAMSKYFYDLDNLKLNEGLGILPIKVLVHYQSDYNSPNIDWEKAYEELKNYKEDLPIVTLREGEFKVF